MILDQFGQPVRPASDALSSVSSWITREITENIAQMSRLQEEWRVDDLRASCGDRRPVRITVKLPWVKGGAE